MNFFENQDRARRGATYSMLLTTTILLIPAALWSFASPWVGKVYWYEPLIVCLVMIPFIAAGCWFQNRRLAGSGNSIAEDFGGYLISVQPEEGDRWLLDIVEEMAIASGSPVPMVYLLGEEGINAFSAGYTPQDSAIVVTYGATVMLNREEMQALVAHLFCQIHNNDMRADTRTMGVSTGVMALAFLAPFAGGGGSTSGMVLVFGFSWLALFNFATSRIARQRKYLADATAAQFTRNPQSVASALKKIGRYEYGSRLGDEESYVFLPMFFAAPYQKLGKELTSPHPPLERRIKRLDPAWNGEYPNVPPLRSLVGNDEPTAENRRQWQQLGAVLTAARRRSGEPPAAHLYQTQIDLSKIPAEVRAAARHTSGAQALIYQLLLCADVSSRAQQLKMLEGLPNPEVVHFLQVLNEPLHGLNRYLRLPLFDLCVPALKRLEADQYKQFTRNITLLTQTDYRTYLMGLALLHILNTQVLATPKPKSRYMLNQLTGDVSVLLGLIAFMGHRGDAQAELAYARACEVLTFHAAPMPTFNDNEELKAVENALNTLQQLNPQDKDILMNAIAVCIEHDGRITHEEIELMRAIANILNCSMPVRLETPSPDDAGATSLLP